MYNGLICTSNEGFYVIRLLVVNCDHILSSVLSLVLKVHGFCMTQRLIAPIISTVQVIFILTFNTCLINNYLHYNEDMNHITLYYVTKIAT